MGTAGKDPVSDVMVTMVLKAQTSWDVSTGRLPVPVLGPFPA